MGAWPELQYSLSEVKRAGKLLRDSHRLPLHVSEDQVLWAEAVLNNWRRVHAEAENWAQMGLRSRLLTIGVDGAVTQRRKEKPTIIAKLVRGYPHQQLSRMQDIAGARAVVPTLEDLRLLQARWHETGARFIVEEDDYVESPPASGYRAVHLVMRHKSRTVEVQLRTHLQQQWGDLVEDLGRRLGAALKNSEGPADVLELLDELAKALARLDRNSGDDAGRERAQALLWELESRVPRGRSRP